MRSAFTNTAVSLLIMAALPAFAYEKLVHVHITQHAALAMTTNFLARLGLDTQAPISGKRPIIWMEEGAHDEDDGFNSLGHFYDPVHDSALTEPFLICASDFFQKANFRAIDASGSQFSVYNAKQYYLSALLGMNPGSRDSDTVLLLQAMGHEMHLIQDMAQPEHTRNDQHLPQSVWILTNGTAASVWEEWGLEYLANHQVQGAIDPYVPFDGYPSVNLPDYYDYFHTASGKGMADFSSTNFVTQDTNYDDSGPTHCFTYALPNSHDDSQRRLAFNVMEEVMDPITGIKTFQPVDEAIFTSQVHDAYQQTSLTDVEHDFYSLLDLETKLLGVQVYSLGDASYLSRAGYLIPRAVGYSAGFVDHFFRGSLSSKWSVGSQTGQANITITNTSAETIGPDGKFYVNYVPGAAYLGNTTSDDTRTILTADLAPAAPGGLPPGASIIFKNIPVPGLKVGDNVTQFERRIAFAGELGNEPDAVIGLVEGASSKKGYRAEITWTGDNSDEVVLWDGAQGVGANTNVGYPPGGLCTSFPFDIFLQHVCMSNPGAGAQPLVFTLDNNGPHTYQLQEWQSTFPGPRIYTTKVYLDGQLLSTTTSPPLSNDGSLAPITFAVFP